MSNTVVRHGRWHTKLSTYSDPRSSTLPSSSAPSSDWPAPPPYAPSDPASSSALNITSSSPTTSVPTQAPQAAHDTSVDLLDGDPSEFSAGPSVPVVVDPIPTLPRQNHLRIHRDGQPVSETLVLDPSLPAPPGTAQKNLELSTRAGPVLARVYIVEARDLKRRVELSATSESGPVKLEILAVCPRTCRLGIIVGSRSGPCSVSLPDHFTGPLTVHTTHGYVTLGTSLQARCRTFEESATVRSYWVGEWSEDGDELRAFQQGEWEGDMCDVTTYSGPVRVGYWEGISTVERVVGGIFKKLFG
ncbi:hypothetical protein CALVIDRAFT_190660 [Calocera viscosa TUFC12733]|uniref:DUF7330 domain-containing protein n=1 Tax=Calocera viscosa (strain TUFC12733) TaxID=1330018 RepID=A0A167KMK6_CALVF|nr:hypothetical protein CALVIDRAFT_190660 [Calocera viscosa TUFC12733]